MEIEQTTNEILGELQAIGSAHYRLFIIAGGSADERSVLLRNLSRYEGLEFLDTGKTLSRALIEIEPAFRALSASDAFSSLVSSAIEKPVCVDHIEILFDQCLHLNPFELLKNVSRKFSLVVSWPGFLSDRALGYAPEQHPSHFRMPLNDIECPVHQLAE